MKDLLDSIIISYNREIPYLLDNKGYSYNRLLDILSKSSYNLREEYGHTAAKYTSKLFSR